MIPGIAQLSRNGSRKVNEDTADVSETGGWTLAVIADGLGGHQSGKLASQLAAETVKHYLWRQSAISSDAVREAVEAANRAVLAAQADAEDDRKTTIAILCASPRAVLCAHVGDSRIYCFRNGKIYYQTRDHSVSQAAVTVGEITQAQIRSHSDRNKLVRVLGANEQAAPDIHEFPIDRSDAFLLCSDGFWQLVYEDEMESALEAAASAEIWLELMHTYLRQRLTDDSDNYSAIAFVPQMDG